jgi:hypothetical protein
MRLDQERQKKEEPKRMEFAKKEIERLGYAITYQDATRLEFVYADAVIKFFPYSGWHSGKTIKDGRGIHNLLKQIK